ncbi:MAG TPA: efflux RND transporter periplasmic adaptor subunit [Anaerolineae bacterium]|nr:efflux RND transporter periplasmic adaptor subunit [Anaerolineae bacterium]
MKRSTVVITIAGVVIITGLAAFRFLQQRGHNDTAAYETVAVRRDTILATVSTSGSVAPKKSVTLSFPAGGLLVELSVKVGQEVEEGQSLARLDARALEWSVRQAEATLRTNEAHLAQTKEGPDAVDVAAAEAAVESAEAAYEAAKTQLGLQSEQLVISEADLRKAELALRDVQAEYDLVAGFRPDIGKLPQAAALERATIDYERAVANYRLQVAAVNDASFKAAASQLAQAEAQLQKLQRTPTQEELTIVEAQVEQSLASLEQARLRLADAVLVAPMSGTVVSLGAEVGEMVTAAVPMVVLANLEQYNVEASVDEADIGLVKIDQDATITLDAFPDAELKGRVARIDPLGNMTSGVVSYDTEIGILPTDVAIRPNMTALADIVVARKQDVLIVPNRAVKRNQSGQYYVEVISGGEVQTRLVTTGLRNELMTEIVNDLSEGELVVVSAPRPTLVDQVGGGMFGFGGSR